MITESNGSGIFDEMRTWRVHHRLRRLEEKCEFCCEANISPDAFERKNLCRNECPTLARINMAKFESGDPLIEICPLMVRGIGGYGRGGIGGYERGGVGEYGHRRIGDGPVAAADAQRADTSQSP
uniref:Uncharacterized protein n=1 Tax=Globodera rostochiensis TaxID=31243 RepID=A0A914IBI7_GLORO